MKEERKGTWCVISFGKDWSVAREAAVARVDVPDDIVFAYIYNPMPTGDHWKPITWARSFKDRGKSSLRRVPVHKRDFAKRAGAILDEGPGSGFCMEITGKACRKFRDDNELRNERGHVFVFVGTVKKEEE